MPERAAPDHVRLQDAAVPMEQWAHGGGQVTAAPHLDDRQGRSHRQDQLHVLLHPVGGCHGLLYGRNSSSLHLLTTQGHKGIGWGQ